MAAIRQVEIELLEAARSCGGSLQKALARPGLSSLCRELALKVEAGTWRPGRHARFAVEEPKLREIFAPCFADRIVEAWLVSWMEPLLERLYIDDNYANRKGRGPLAAIRKAQKSMRQPGHTWCLQLDVKSFKRLNCLVFHMQTSYVQENKRHEAPGLHINL